MMRRRIMHGEAFRPEVHADLRSGNDRRKGRETIAQRGSLRVYTVHNKFGTYSNVDRRSGGERRKK